MDVDTVVWATGYRPDYTWMPTEAVGPDGCPLNRRGITPIPGLAVLGLPWMHTRGSALLGFVGSDADWVVSHILDPRATAPPATRASSPDTTRSLEGSIR